MNHPHPHEPQKSSWTAHILLNYPSPAHVLMNHLNPHRLPVWTAQSSRPSQALMNCPGPHDLPTASWSAHILMYCPGPHELPVSSQNAQFNFIVTVPSSSLPLINCPSSSRNRCHHRSSMKPYQCIFRLISTVTGSYFFAFSLLLLKRYLYECIYRVYMDKNYSPVFRSFSQTFPVPFGLVNIVRRHDVARVKCCAILVVFMFRFASYTDENQC